MAVPLIPTETRLSVLGVRQGQRRKLGPLAHRPNGVRLGGRERPLALLALVLRLVRVPEAWGAVGWDASLP